MQIITLQRTGSHYLVYLIEAYFGLDRIEKYHDVENADGIVISIARDPLDSMSSDLSMHFHYHGWQEDNVRSIVDKYVKIGNQICDRADIVIKYDDLIYNPLGVIKFIAEKVNINLLNSPSKSYEVVDKPNYKYLKSSTVYQDYDKVREILSSMDLSKAYELYEKFLSKSSTIPDS
jgi:hypothetical protein